MSELKSYTVQYDPSIGKHVIWERNTRLSVAEIVKASTEVFTGIPLSNLEITPSGHRIVVSVDPTKRK